MSDYPSDDLGWLMNLLLAKAAGRDTLYGICAKAIRRAHQQLRDERASANPAPQEPPDAWRKRAEALWQLLDDIDTLDDACREDDAAFRHHAREIQQRRHAILTSDGYALSPPTSPPDAMACGCWWVRSEVYGDVLNQCGRHKAGDTYDGSEPLSPEDGDRLIRTLEDGGFEVGPHIYGRANTESTAAPQEPPTRPNHLAWNSTEWVDERCGCRYHPDDDGGSHGGAPHVHRCERHAEPAVPNRPGWWWRHDEPVLVEQEEDGLLYDETDLVTDWKPGSWQGPCLSVDVRPPPAEPTEAPKPHTLTLPEVMAGTERAAERVAKWPQWKRDLTPRENEVMARALRRSVTVVEGAPKPTSGDITAGGRPLAETDEERRHYTHDADPSNTGGGR